MTMAFHSSRNETSPYSYSSAFASSSVANFTSKASPLTMKSSFSPSPSANVRLHSQRSPSSSPSPSPSPASSLRLSVEQQPKSPGRRSMTVTNDMRNNKAMSSSKSRPCMCSPTSHPGSFRCAYHKRVAEQEQQRKQKQLQQQQQRQQKASSRSRTLNLRRTAMNNSLVLIGGVEGEVVKRTLTTLIRPSPLQLRRREAFQTKPSRLSLMSKAEDS